MGVPFSSLTVDGGPRLPEGAGGNVGWRAVTPGYFAALGIPLLRGHTLDRPQGSMVLSESLATRLTAKRRAIAACDSSWLCTARRIRSRKSWE